jgi:AcrR family transcriptional regulator
MARLTKRKVKRKRRPSNGVTRRLSAASRREQLLEVAAKCFARHGYQATTMALIADAAGITEPVIYQHFKNKLSLFIALLRQVGESVLSRWRVLIAEIDLPLDRLEALLHRNPAVVPQTAPIYRMVFAAQSELGEPGVQKAITEHYEQYVDLLSGILREGQRRRQVRMDTDARTLAWQLVHAAVGFGMIRPMGFSEHVSEKFIKTTIRLLLEEMAPDRGA